MELSPSLPDISRLLRNQDLMNIALQNHANMLTYTKKHALERFFSASKTDHVHNTYMGQYAGHGPRRDTTSFYEHLRGVYAGGKHPVEGV